MKEENTNLHMIKITEFYKENCSEQETVEVSDEVLALLMEEKRKNGNYKKWEKTHRAVGVYLDSEDYIGALGFTSKSGIDEVETAIWLEQALRRCSDIVIRRAKLKYLQHMTTREIAKLESVNHTSVAESLRIAKRVLMELQEKEEK